MGMVGLLLLDWLFSITIKSPSLAHTLAPDVQFCAVHACPTAEWVPASSVRTKISTLANETTRIQFLFIIFLSKTS